MTDNQFEALVARLETQAIRAPRSYQFKVLALALLGNAYLGLMIFIVSALLVVLMISVTVLKAFAIKLILVVGFFLWLIIKALWIRIEPPTGMTISADEAPQLFAMIEDLRKQLRAPRFHHVLIIDELNAAVVQSPRLGIFGWPRNYLLLGLPLMKTLTVEQFKAVLAHEFGHLAKQHGRLSNWIYRQRLRWSRLLDILNAHESRGSFLFKPFLKWFSPYFNAYSFPLARANEYEADATSVRLTSSAATAQALTSINVVGHYLDEQYWPGIHGQVKDLPLPSFAPFSAMGQGMTQAIEPEAANSWLGKALQRVTSTADTHPALKDRLAAIGEAACLHLPAEHEAADSLLGSAKERIASHFDRGWQQNIEQAWLQRHQEICQNRVHLEELNRKSAAGETLSVQERYDRALLTESIAEQAEEALAQLQALHESVPDDSVIRLALGARLLGRDDESGAAHVMAAMQLDESLTVRACELLRDYHWRNDRQDEAHAWQNQMAERIAVEQGAEQERNTIRTTDKFEVHGLAEAAVDNLCQQLQAIPGLRKAYLVRKHVKYLAHRPFYVFGYRVQGWWQLHSKAKVADALRQIQASVIFPGETMIINVEGENYRFGRKLFWMRGARIL
jgi:Zn-dependent protease with chaperone function